MGLLFRCKKQLRTGLRSVLEWALEDAHLRGVHFGEHSITLSPAGVGDVIRWDAAAAPTVIRDLGMRTDGRPAAFYLGFAQPVLMDTNGNNLIGTMNWMTITGIPAGATRYFIFVGTVNATESITQIRMPKTKVARLYIRAGTGPGAARVDVVTVRKNGAGTALTTSLTGAATSNQDTTNSVAFADGDLLSIELVTAAATTLANVRVGIELQ